MDHPVTADSTDVELAVMAHALAPVINTDEDGATPFILVASALRELLRGGQSPAQAVRTIGSIALFASGCDYDQVPGERIKARD